jgi:MFS family permease
MPFLLPLMLQLAFGDSAMQSGLITFASAVGALSMKPAAQPMLRWFGFRTVLVVNGILAAGFVAICALFNASWPSLLLAGVLLLGGLFRSLQFTAFNSIAYGDVPRSRMETATMLRHHSAASTTDFGVAFVGVSLIAALAIPICAMLPHDAGEALSGHHAGDK